MTTLSFDPTTLPGTPRARQTWEFVKAAVSESIANHSARSYLFARLLAAHRGMRPGHDYDDELLFFACALHDMGLSERGNGTQRFEADGADVAAEFLAAQGVSSGDIDVVWQAIALHTSGGIAARRGPICELTRGGVLLDIDADRAIVSDDVAGAIHAVYPRLTMARELVDAIVAQAKARPAKAPRYSLPDSFIRERAVAPYLTAIEAAALAGRWGE
jgi:hypothetical protein